MNWNVGDLFRDRDETLDIVKVKFRVYTLREHIESKGYNIHIPGTFAIAKQCAFNPFATGHKCKFCSGYRAPSVIMGMQANKNRLTILQIIAKPLYLIGIHIGCCHFNRGRKVNNNRIVRCRFPYVHNCLTNMERKIQLCPGKTFRRIFIAKTGFRIFGSFLPDHRRAFNSKCCDLITTHLKNSPALKCGCGVVKMHHYIFCPFHCLESFLNEVSTCRSEDLNGNIIRDKIILNKSTGKIKFDLRGRWKANLNLFKTNISE